MSEPNLTKSYKLQIFTFISIYGKRKGQVQQNDFQLLMYLDSNQNNAAIEPYSLTQLNAVLIILFLLHVNLANNFLCNFI